MTLNTRSHYPQPLPAAIVLGYAVANPARVKSANGLVSASELCPHCKRSYYYLSLKDNLVVLYL